VTDIVRGLSQWILQRRADHSRTTLPAPNFDGAGSLRPAWAVIDILSMGSLRAEVRDSEQRG
jgi:hypothetical protein